MDVAQHRATWSAAWGVLAMLFGAGVVPIWLTARSPKSDIPMWPAWMLAGLTVSAMYISISYLTGRWWPVIGKRGRSGKVDLIPERVDECLRLILVNDGPATQFFVQVISVIPPLGKWEPSQNWTIPWLEDSSTEPKLILAGARRPLDFARYDAAAVTADLGKGSNGTAHWRFPTVPRTIEARYYNLLRLEDLEDQHFTLTVRIMSASSEHYLDRVLTVGIRNGNPACDIAPIGAGR